MKKGFITFCTENYIPIINNLVESVLEFSKHDITVYGINFNYFHNNSRVKAKKINLDTVDYYNVCKAKIIASIDAEYEYCLILDGDMIVTKEIDNLFDENEEKIQNLDFPLFAKHPHNPFENPNHKETLKKMISRYTDKSPKMKYVYASYLFTSKNKWFLKEVLDEMNILKNSPGEDEFIINSLLTKYQVDYDIGYNYLPNCTESILQSYFDNSFNCEELYETYLKHDCPIKFYMFHGHKCKDIKFTEQLIKKIKDKK